MLCIVLIIINASQYKFSLGTPISCVLRNDTGLFRYVVVASDTLLLRVIVNIFSDGKVGSKAFFVG